MEESLGQQIGGHSRQLEELREKVAAVEGEAVRSVLAVSTEQTARVNALEVTLRGELTAEHSTLSGRTQQLQVRYRHPYNKHRTSTFCMGR